MIIFVIYVITVIFSSSINIYIYKNGRDSVPSSRLNLHPELEIVSNFFANDVTLMSAYDSVHYCKYLSLYWSTMNDLDQEKVSFMNAGLFEASMSGQSFSGLAQD